MPLSNLNSLNHKSLSFLNVLAVVNKGFVKQPTEIFVRLNSFLIKRIRYKNCAIRFCYDAPTLFSFIISLILVFATFFLDLPASKDSSQAVAYGGLI